MTLAEKSMKKVKPRGKLLQNEHKNDIFQSLCICVVKNDKIINVCS
jgi:hypothetical protein